MKKYPVTLQLYALPGQFRRGDYTEEQWIQFFTTIRQETGIKEIETFAFQWEPKGVWNKYSPWRKVGPDWNLLKHDPKWWKGEDRLDRCVKKGGMTIRSVAVSKYQEEPYLRNVNNVNGLFDLRARPIQIRLERKQYRYRRRYWPVKPLWDRQVNEVGHGGDWPYGIWMNKHLAFLHEKTKDQISIFRKIYDTSHSDFMALCEVHYLCWVSLDGGDPITETMLPEGTYLRFKAKGWIVNTLDKWGKNEYGRKGWIELHGVGHKSILRPFELGALKSLLWRIASCGWWKWLLSTDGLCDGSIIPAVPSWSWRDMSRDEIHEYRETLSTLPGRILIRIGELDKGIFFVNSDKVVEEDNMKLIEPDNLDRLAAWRD